MNSDERYSAITARISGGGVSLCRKDTAFYLNYCYAHSITPVCVHTDDSVASVSADVSNRRYTDIMGRLDAGRGIESSDFKFLQRYCSRTGTEMPRLESKLLFWKAK